MRREDVQVGQTYEIKVSGRIVPGKVVGTLYPKGWIVVNMTTNREICVRSARRFRRPWERKRSENA